MSLSKSLLLFIYIAGILCSHHAISHDTAVEDSNIPARRLRAAKRSHQLDSRDVKGCLKYDHELHYVDGRSSSPLNGLC